MSSTLSCLTVVELRARLAARGLARTGRKADLVARLLDIGAEVAEPPLQKFGEEMEGLSPTEPPKKKAKAVKAEKTACVADCRAGPGSACPNWREKGNEGHLSCIEVEARLLRLGRDPATVSHCIKAAVMRGHVKLAGVAGDLEQEVACGGGVLQCGHRPRVTLGSILGQPDYGDPDGPDLCSGGRFDGVNCPVGVQDDEVIEIRKAELNRPREPAARFGFGPTMSKKRKKQMEVSMKEAREKARVSGLKRAEESRGQECGLEGQTYLSGLCEGQPRLTLKGHNHCKACPDFGSCIGDFRELHCSNCHGHYFGGRYEAYYCDCTPARPDDGDNDSEHRVRATPGPGSKKKRCSSKKATEVSSKMTKQSSSKSKKAKPGIPRTKKGLVAVLMPFLSIQKAAAGTKKGSRKGREEPVAVKAREAGPSSGTRAGPSSGTRAGRRGNQSQVQEEAQRVTRSGGTY